MLIYKVTTQVEYPPKCEDGEGRVQGYCGKDDVWEAKHPVVEDSFAQVKVFHGATHPKRTPHQIGDTTAVVVNVNQLRSEHSEHEDCGRCEVRV